MPATTGNGKPQYPMPCFGLLLCLFEYIKHVFCAMRVCLCFRMSEVRPIEHSEIIVYQNLELVYIDKKLMKPHFNTLAFKKMIEDHSPEDYEYTLVVDDVRAPFVLFISPKAWIGPRIFTLFSGLGFLPVGRSNNYDECVVTIQHCMRSKARKRWMQRFELAVRHPKSKLWQLLFQKNSDLELLVLQFLC